MKELHKSFYLRKREVTKRVPYTHLINLRPKDGLRMSPKDVLMTSPYGPLCNAKGSPLPTSLGRPLLTCLGRWSMTSWGRPNVTSWGRPHIVLYIMPSEVPYQHLVDVSGRGYEDVPVRSNILLQGKCSTDVLRTSIRDVQRKS